MHIYQYLPFDTMLFYSAHYFHWLDARLLFVQYFTDRSLHRIKRKKEREDHPSLGFNLHQNTTLVPSFLSNIPTFSFGLTVHLFLLFPPLSFLSAFLCHLALFHPSSFCFPLQPLFSSLPFSSSSSSPVHVRLPPFISPLISPSSHISFLSNLRL